MDFTFMKAALPQYSHIWVVGHRYYWGKDLIGLCWVANTLAVRFKTWTPRQKMHPAYLKYSRAKKKTAPQK
jgi:hypothetical protein